MIQSEKHSSPKLQIATTALAMKIKGTRIKGVEAIQATEWYQTRLLSCSLIVVLPLTSNPRNTDEPLNS